MKATGAATAIADRAERERVTQERLIVDEMERAGGVVWRPAANTSCRWNGDVFGHDLLCLAGSDLLMVQVKATARDPWPPAPI